MSAHSHRNTPTPFPSLTIRRMDKMIRWSLPVIAFLLLVLLVSLIALGCQSMNAGGGKETGTGAETAVGTSPVANDPPAGGDVVLPQTADAGMAYQDKLTFVGDSLTAHLASRGVLSGGTNTTQVWRTTTNMLNLNSEITSARIVLPGTGESVTIAQAAAKVQPPILIITLGTDWGVSYLNETDFKACYGDLVRAVKEASPTTTVILQSIFPVTAGCKVLTNEKIDQANTWVKAVAAETGCRYLDTQSVLKDGNNCLKAEYCASTDGIHLTAEAYQVILSYIRTHAVQ